MCPLSYKKKQKHLHLEYNFQSISNAQL